MSLLATATQSAPGVSLYAPASGGGGGGGDLQNLSTIEFSAIPGQIIATAELDIDFINSGIVPDFSFQSPPSYQPRFPSGFASTNASIFTQNAPEGFGTYRVAVGKDEAVYIDASGANGLMGIYINAGAVITQAATISSITCSTINGAAPGGGGSVPADLAVSTLQLNDQPVANGARLRMRGADPNLYAVDVVDSNGTFVAGYNLGTSGGRNQFYTGVGEVDQCFVSSINGVGGPIQVLNAMNIANVLTATTANVTMSTLTVSTINGIVPGQAANGGAIGVQSIPDTGPIPCVCDAPGGSGLPTLLTAALGISTVLGHTYTYTAEASIQGGPNQTADSAFQLQLGNNSRFYGDVKPVSTIVGPNTLVSLNWRFIGSGGGNAIYAYNWDPLSNAASTIIQLSKQSLTDYGIIL